MKKGSLGVWIMDRIRRRTGGQPRLALVARITLAPRQTLALVEADGQKLLVATSVEGAPNFFPLGSARRSRTRTEGTAERRSA